MPRQELKTLTDLPAATSGADALLGGLGISAALVSASFAGYMVMTSPDLALAPANRSDAVVSPEQGIPPRAVGRNAQPIAGRTATADDPDIDFTPTGTVAADEADPQHGNDDPQSPRLSMNDLSVRDVFDGTALVEARGSLQLVKPGTVLEGVGKVLSIEQRGKSLLVVTTGGVIRQRP